MDNKITVEMGIYPPNMFVGAEETITRPSHMSFRADSGSTTLDIHQLLDHAEAKAVIFLMRLAAVAFGFHHELFVGSLSLPLIFQTFPESLISDVYLMGVCMQFWGLNDMGAVEKRPCSDVVGGKSSFRRSEDLSGCGSFSEVFGRRRAGTDV
jgi:hypothetical protein